MSHPANLVHIKNGEIIVAGSRSGALSITWLLASGLKAFLDYFDYRDYIYPYNYDERDSISLCYSDEGGLLIDEDEKYILWFTDDCFNPYCLRFFTEYLTSTIWIDWNINYCIRGNYEIAEYLNIANEYKEEQKEYYDKYFNLERNNNDNTIEKALDSKILEYYPDVKQYVVITTIKNEHIVHYKLNNCDAYWFDILADWEKNYTKIPAENIITNWLKENHTHRTLLIDYDAKKIYISDKYVIEKAYVDLTQIQYPDWEICLQKDGLVFHFWYNDQDDSAVALSKEEFLNLSASELFYDEGEKTIKDVLEENKP